MRRTIDRAKQYLIEGPKRWNEKLLQDKAKAEEFKKQREEYQATKKREEEEREAQAKAQAESEQQAKAWEKIKTNWLVGNLRRTSDTRDHFRRNSEDASERRKRELARIDQMHCAAADKKQERRDVEREYDDQMRLARNGRNRDEQRDFVKEWQFIRALASLTQSQRDELFHDLLHMRFNGPHMDWTVLDDALNDPDDSQWPESTWEVVLVEAEAFPFGRPRPDAAALAAAWTPAAFAPIMPTYVPAHAHGR